jgi:hypothetical protein
MNKVVFNIFMLMFPCWIFGQTILMGSGDTNLFSQRQQSNTRHFRIYSSYRLRGEVQDEFNNNTYGTDQHEKLLLSRLRLELDIKFNSKVNAHFQFQDARVMGSSFADEDFASGNNPFHDPLDINQAFFEFRPIETVNFKIGRQAISFRDRRMFGPGDWGNTGRYAWDAALFTFSNRFLESHWIFGRYILHNPDRWPNQSAKGPTIYACYSTIKNLPVFLDLFYIYKDDQRGITKGEFGTGDLNSHSIGCWLSGKMATWDYSVSVVKQFGKWGPDKINAMAIVLSSGYKFNIIGKPHLQIQFIQGSGDKNPEDGINNTFDGLLGGADTDLYGWMNLFFWKNLNEYRLKLTFTPVKKFTVRGEYHYFRLDEPRDAWYFPGKAQRRDKSGTAGSELGHEFDFIITYPITKFLDLRGGTCVFNPGDFIRSTGKNPVAQWYFVETTVKF